MDENTGHEDKFLLDTNHADSNLNDVYVRVKHNTPPTHTHTQNGDLKTE